MNPPADNDSCIGIASALIFDPQFLMADQAVAALDVPIQAQILSSHPHPE
jgi:ABC-type oligopeptide transport system ATPase subunit